MIEAHQYTQLSTEDSPLNRPTREQAEEAVRTLIAWAGDDPAREGLLETPARVVRAYEEFFSGYQQSLDEVLDRTFDDVKDYEDMVLVRDIRFESHCEHHMVPIIGTAHVAYVPNQRVVGISKLARLVDMFAKRLQTQEVMTNQIATALQTVLEPKGVAVMIDACHQCMTTRGVYKPGAMTQTARCLGQFQTDEALKSRFFQSVR